MMDAGRHPRIELHTLSELVGLNGRAGSFEAQLLKHPRYVDDHLCVGCGLCELECDKIVYGEPAILTFAHGRGQPTVLRQVPTKDYEPPVGQGLKFDPDAFKDG